MGTRVCGRQCNAVRPFAVRASEQTSPPRLIHDAASRRMGPIRASRPPFPVELQGILVSQDPLSPHDHAEAVALFRSGIIGALVRRELTRGELAVAIRALAADRYRPPGRSATKRFGISTLERWYYAYRRGGLAALRSSPRSDRGRARELTAEQRALLLDIRREHPLATVPVILRTLVADGRLAAGAVSASTIQRNCPRIDA